MVAEALVAAITTVACISSSSASIATTPAWVMAMVTTPSSTKSRLETRVKARVETIPASTSATVTDPSGRRLSGTHPSLLSSPL
jgi:hypothetical protein